MNVSTTDYDRGVNTFSPEGRLHQIEYAKKAIENGTTSIGIKTNEGVVLAVEKKILSIFIKPKSVKKIHEIDSHLACAMSGIAADARSLVEHARVQSQNHWFVYDEKISPEALARSVSDLALGFGGSGKHRMARPFGVALLIAGVNDKGQCTLWLTEPTGTYTEFKACAIGSGANSAKSHLASAWRANMTLEQAKKLAIKTLKQVMKDKVSSRNCELAVVTSEGKFEKCKLDPYL